MLSWCPAVTPEKPGAAEASVPSEAHGRGCVAGCWKGSDPASAAWCGVGLSGAGDAVTSPRSLSALLPPHTTPCPPRGTVSPGARRGWGAAGREGRVVPTTPTEVLWSGRGDVRASPARGPGRPISFPYGPRPPHLATRRSPSRGRGAGPLRLGCAGPPGAHVSSGSGLTRGAGAAEARTSGEGAGAPLASAAAPAGSSPPTPPPPQRLARLAPPPREPRPPLPDAGSTAGGAAPRSARPEPRAPSAEPARPLRPQRARRLQTCCSSPAEGWRRGKQEPGGGRGEGKGSQSGNFWPSRLPRH